jgi:hypothetical protein
MSTHYVHIGASRYEPYLTDKEAANCKLRFFPNIQDPSLERQHYFAHSKEYQLWNPLRYSKVIPMDHYMVIYEARKD